MMTGGALASGSFFGKALHDALAGFWSKGMLVVRRGKEGFFLGSIFVHAQFEDEVMKVEMF
jgi:hypothetical protein